LFIVEASDEQLRRNGCFKIHCNFFFTKIQKNTDSYWSVPD